MDKTKETPQIEIGDNFIKIGNVVLDREALEILEDIQNDLGDHYRRTIGIVRNLILDSCEDLPIGYDETIHILQALSNLGRDINALMWAVNPLPPELSYSRRRRPDCDIDDMYRDTVEAMELADANDDPHADGDSSVTVPIENG